MLTNGTQVLGLGDIGVQAAKPVMEGNVVLLKELADINAMDIGIDTKDAQEFIKTAKLMEPTFGGVILEDIKAPECFEIEAALTESMNIPVLHNDQHAAAIAILAALINSCLIQEKDIKIANIVILGAGVSGIAFSQILVDYGIPVSNFLLVDS